MISHSELIHENSNRQFIITKNNQNMKLSRITADFINNVIMIDKLKQHLVISKKKKLFKKLKTKLFKVSERILTLFMNQKVCDVIVKDLLKFSLAVHKMMFQNLLIKMIKKESETEMNKIIITSEKIMNE